LTGSLVAPRQDELRAEFGGFTEGYINIAGIVASPDGKRIGFAFVADDGTKSRVVLDSEFAADQFHTALAYAIDEAVRFHLGGVPPQGRA
jgi:hypothetical protein